MPICVMMKPTTSATSDQMKRSVRCREIYIPPARISSAPIVVYCPIVPLRLISFSFLTIFMKISSMSAPALAWAIPAAYDVWFTTRQAGLCCFGNLLPLQAFFDRRADRVQHLCLGGLFPLPDGVLDCQRVGAAVSDEHQSVHAQQDGRAGLAGIQQLAD